LDKSTPTLFPYRQYTVFLDFRQTFFGLAGVFLVAVFGFAVAGFLMEAGFFGSGSLNPSHLPIKFITLSFFI
jgi:hypothetical protein